MSKSFMPIEQYYALKSTFENLWGKDTYLELKHCSSISIWKKYAKKTLEASLMAIEETIEIKDNYWQKGAKDFIAHGIERVRISRTFDELFNSLSATYIELSFHQIGLMPSRRSRKKVALRKQDWKLDAHRTTQYVQFPEQKETHARFIKNREEKIKDAEDKGY